MGPLLGDLRFPNHSASRLQSSRSKARAACSAYAATSTLRHPGQPHALTERSARQDKSDCRSVHWQHESGGW